eukprot:9624439-Lingulodinium_polyedra.AAC.1
MLAAAQNLAQGPHLVDEVGDLGGVVQPVAREQGPPLLAPKRHAALQGRNKVVKVFIGGSLA